MSLMKRVVDMYKKKTDREDMCLHELDKEKRKRKWVFVLIYLSFISLSYLGIVLVDNSIIFLLFVLILLGVLTVITGMDFIFTRLLYYMKYNER